MATNEESLVPVAVSPEEKLVVAWGKLRLNEGIIMCLAVPTKIIKISGDMADVEIGGVSIKASIQLVPSAKVGDYILLHAGFAIELLDENEALETLELLGQMSEVS